ncbi:MAG: hypothetical protein HQL78_02620 [Magnetococcales bacterium]|nr:hypothetical protein [Magnetococcales bacterium]
MKTIVTLAFRVGLLVSLLLIGSVALAGDRGTLPDRVKEAIESFSKAQNERDAAIRMEGFRQAERLFAALADEVGANVELETNIGVAAVQGGHVGAAVLAFRRALLLDPTHERARINLHYARSLLPSWVPRPAEEGGWDRFLSWWFLFSESKRQALGALFFLLAASGILVAVRFGSPLARFGAVIPSVLWMAVIAQGVWNHEGRDDAVIIPEETLARAADSINAPLSFAQPLPSGTEVTVLERREDWCRIALGNGRSAWIRSSALVMVQGKTREPSNQ